MRSLQYLLLLQLQMGAYSIMILFQALSQALIMAQHKIQEVLYSKL